MCMKFVRQIYMYLHTVRQFFSAYVMSPRARQGSRLSAHFHGCCMHFSICMTDKRVRKTGKYRLSEK